MFRGACVALLLFAVPAGAEIIDRIAVSLDHQIIALSQVIDEIRVTAFLNREPLDLSAAGKKRAAERLVEQTLIRREMDLSHYAMPKQEEADKLEEQVEDTYGGRVKFEQGLEKYGVSEPDLKRHLWFELATVRFVDYRFRPGIQIPEDQLREYYQKKLVEWKAKGVEPIPTFRQSRAGLEEVMLEERSNQALDLWLGEVRTQADIVYHEEALR